MEAFHCEGSTELLSQRQATGFESGQLTLSPSQPLFKMRQSPSMGGLPNCTDRYLPVNRNHRYQGHVSPFVASSQVLMPVKTEWAMDDLQYLGPTGRISVHTNAGIDYGSNLVPYLHNLPPGEYSYISAIPFDANTLSPSYSAWHQPGAHIPYHGHGLPTNQSHVPRAQNTQRFREYLSPTTRPATTFSEQPEVKKEIEGACEDLVPYEVAVQDKLGDIPYAKLIYSALMDAPGHRMVLKDIYRWIEKNTDKANNPEFTGWQNSVRHNLSMNKVVSPDCKY